MFSLIDGIYLSPLPYREDAQLIDIENQYRNMGLDATGASIPDYLDRRKMKSIVESTLYAGMDFNLAVDGAPRARTRNPRDAVAVRDARRRARARSRIQRR